MYRNRSGKPLTIIIVKILSMGMVPVAVGSKIASKVVSRALERASEYAAKVPVIVILKRFSNAC